MRHALKPLGKLSYWYQVVGFSFRMLLIVWRTYGETQEEHDSRLRQILQHLQESNLMLNKEKCKFSVSQVSFLGQNVNGSGIRPDPENVSAVTNMPAPKNVGDVHHFLGMMRFHFIIITHPWKRSTLSPEHQWADDHLVMETNAFINIIINNLPASEERLDEIWCQLAEDVACQQIMMYCRTV